MDVIQTKFIFYVESRGTNVFRGRHTLLQIRIYMHMYNKEKYNNCVAGLVYNIVHGKYLDILVGFFYNTKYM